MYRELKQMLGMVLVDLDGTLLNDQKEIGDNDFRSLQILGDSGIVRVFATGRNLYSVGNILSDDCPYDYLIFSSGAGILEWNSKKLLFNSSIPKSEVLEIEKQLKILDLNFSIHFPIPENHKYYYHKANSSAKDFDKRNEIYNNFRYPLNGFYPLDSASQFLIIINEESEIEAITNCIHGFNIIRATSPIDGKSVWIEIFAENVSKASGADFLCNMLNIPRHKTLAIGNDYNDLELLNWTPNGYVVSNAPEIIKSKFKLCADNQNNPLFDVLTRFMG